MLVRLRTGKICVAYCCRAAALIAAAVLSYCACGVNITAAQEGRSIELILDASGSMHGRLGDGTVKLTAAKEAVGHFVNNLEPSVRLAYRAYGHQSPRQAHDCEDTQLIAGFNNAGSLRDEVIQMTKDLPAQGYTPITYVIGLAADDLKKEDSAEHIVVLVSDGKETCEGDPCATALKLKGANAKLVIHTVGFAVDDAARFQLQCIADATGGTYSSAGSTIELEERLGEAAQAEDGDEVVITIKKAPGPGRLEVKSASLLGHDVTDAETGEKVASLSQFQTVVELPAGIYNVGFGETLWKSVVVESGETTVLEPGVLIIENPDFSHEIRDSETGELVASVNSSLPKTTLIPSTFDVTFGKAIWPDVKVGAGEEKVLKAGRIEVTGANAEILNSAGESLVELGGVKTGVSLPPGNYLVRLAGQDAPIKLGEGKTVKLNVE